MTHIHDCFVSLRGNPGWWSWTVSGELRRQPGWRLWDLQWVRRVHKGKSTMFIITFIIIILSVITENIWQPSFRVILQRLCFFSVLVLYSTPLSSGIMKKHSQAFRFATVWLTICYWLILSCLWKQSSIHNQHEGVNPMLLNTSYALETKDRRNDLLWMKQPSDGWVWLSLHCYCLIMRG